MTRFNTLFSSLKKMTAGAVLLGVSLSAYAANFTLDSGQSRTIRTTKKIDAIFASAPEIANYQIIDDFTFVVYAAGEGSAEVTAFDDQGNPISTNNITVNTLLRSISGNNASAEIKRSLGNGKTSVEKVGKAYVVKGTAQSVSEQESVNAIVGEALGGGKKVTETTLEYGSSSIKLPFLDKVQYDGVVNNVTTPSPAQINVKLTVVEVNKDFSESLGINWANLNGSVIGGFSPTGLFSAGGAVNSASFGTVAPTGGFWGINARTLSAFITAVNTQTNARILAEPNMSMLSGETASLLVGGEIPYVVRDNDSTSVQYKEYGVKLAVGAKVMNNNRIRMALAQEVSDIVDYFTYDNNRLPILGTNRSQSVVELNNGESFVLGGLMTSKDSEVLSKVPMLGDVPILGAMFRNATTDRKKKELVIIATVNYTYPVAANQVVYPTFKRTANLERFFNIDPILSEKERQAAAAFLEQGGFIQ